MKFHPTFYKVCNYLSMLGLKLNHVSKRGPCSVLLKETPDEKNLRSTLFRHRYNTFTWINWQLILIWGITVYPKKYAHGFAVLCFVVVMQSFIMNSHEVFIHIHQGCFAGTGAIVRLPQCQWSKPDGYGKISQCITTTKHSKAVTMCIFLGIYCTSLGKN